LKLLKQNQHNIDDFQNIFPNRLASGKIGDSESKKSYLILKTQFTGAGSNYGKKLTTDLGSCSIADKILKIE